MSELEDGNPFRSEPDVILRWKEAIHGTRADRLQLAAEFLYDPEPSVTRRFFAAELLKACGRHEEAKALYVALGKEQPEHFHFWRDYAEAGFSHEFLRKSVESREEHAVDNNGAAQEGE